MSTETTNKKIKIDNGTTFGKTYTDKAVDERLQGLVSTATFTPVKEKADNSLQKPAGLTKTELVGVGTNGQENIEIGDNLTLANGKLSATGGVNGLESDAEGNLTASKDLKVDGKLKSKQIDNDSNPGGPLFKKGFLNDGGASSIADSTTLSYAGRTFDRDHAYWGPIISAGNYSDYATVIFAIDSFISKMSLSKRLYYHFIKLTSANGIVVFSFEHQADYAFSSIRLLIDSLGTVHVCANGKIGESAVLGIGVENKKLVAITADSTIDLTGYTITDTIGKRGDM